MNNISLEAIQNGTDLNYIGISKNLDFMVNNSDIMYENATVNITNVCPNISWDYFTLWPLIGFISVAVVGAFLCLFGYRFLRASVFIISVIMFSGLIYVVCCEVVASSLPPLVVAGSSLLSGILGGSLSILLLSCFGSRVVAVSAGVTIVTYLLLVLRIAFQFPLPVAATASESLGLYGTAVDLDRDNHTSEYFFSRRSTEKSLEWIDVFPAVVSLVSMAIGGCVMLVASFLRPKASLVLSTSVVGSAMLGLTADFFTDRVMVLSRVSLDCLAVKVTLVEDLCHLGRCCCCWVGWTVVGVVPVLVLLSNVVQWCCTSPEVDHELDKLGLVSCGPCGSERQTGVPVLMEPSEKYRHLYRIRRTNGDIISRTHMEAIEVRRSNPSLMLTTARSNSDVVTTTDDDATLVLTQTLDE